VKDGETSIDSVAFSIFILVTSNGLQSMFICEIKEVSMGSLNRMSILLSDLTDFKQICGGLKSVFFSVIEFSYPGVHFLKKTSCMLVRRICLHPSVLSYIHLFYSQKNDTTILNSLFHQ